MIKENSPDNIQVKLIDFNVSRKFRGRNFLRSADESPVTKRLMMMS